MNDIRSIVIDEVAKAHGKQVSEISETTLVYEGLDFMQRSALKAHICQGTGKAWTSGNLQQLTVSDLVRKLSV